MVMPALRSFLAAFSKLPANWLSFLFASPKAFMSVGPDTLPEMAAWTAWCHEGPADIHLPSGRLYRAGRGAEQGDPHGSLQAGLVLARRVRRATAIVNSTRWGREGYFSCWFADDGQVLCRPIQLDGLCAAAKLTKYGRFFVSRRLKTQGVWVGFG